MVPYNEIKKCTYFLSELARNEQPSAKNLILIARSVKMAMVPSMVPYYYMQMRQKIKEQNGSD